MAGLFALLSEESLFYGYYSNLPSAPGGIPTWSQAVPGSKDLPLPHLPSWLWPWVLTQPDFPKLPSSKFLLHLEGLPGDLPGVFLPRFLRLGGHAGHCQLLAESIAPLWNRAPWSAEGRQPQASLRLPLQASPPGPLHLAPVPKGRSIEDIPRRTEHGEMASLPSRSTDQRLQENPKQLFVWGRVRKSLAGLRGSSAPLTSIPRREAHPAGPLEGRQPRRTHSYSGPPVPAGCRRCSGVRCRNPHCPACGSCNVSLCPCAVGRSLARTKSSSLRGPERNHPVSAP